MKIAIINNIYPPEQRGGAEVVVKGIVEMLALAGHDVFVITGTAGEASILNEGRVRVYRLPPRNIYYYTDAKAHNPVIRLIWHLYGMVNFSLARRVREILANEKPDMVHTHNLIGLSFLIPHEIRSLKLPHIHTVHDVQLVEPSGMIIKKFENTWRYRGWPTKIYSALMRRLMGSPSVIISPSKFLRSFYEARGFFRNSRIETLRNPMTLSAAWLPRQNDADIFRYLFLGQVEEHKGILTLIEAFKKLSITITDNIELLVVGAGSVENMAKKAAIGLNIRFLGYKKRDELAHIFSSADVTVVSSLCYENSPTVIFESRLFGLPIIASDIEGVAELIEDNQGGWLFDAGDAHDLYEKMLNVYHERDVIRRYRSIPPRPSTNEDFSASLLDLYQWARKK